MDVISGHPQDVRLASPGRSNKIFRGCPGDAEGERPGDQYLLAGLSIINKLEKGFTEFVV